MLKACFKSRIPYFILLLVFLIVFGILQFSFSMPFEAIVYGYILVLICTALLFALDIARARKIQKQIMEEKKLVEECEFYSLKLPENNHALAKAYSELIYALDEKLSSLQVKNSIQISEMEDYYTMWVHQIKTPISAMSLLLQSDNISPNQLKSELFKIQQYAEMALAYIRLESINSDLSFSSISVDKIIKSTLKKFAMSFILKKLSVDYQESNLRIISDEKWLAFVFEQVLSNAVKYTKEGIIKIYTNGDALYIEDNGIGIIPEDLPRVFEKGYTGYNGRLDKKSTGLGLYLSKKTMDILGHKIDISSDKGTTVKLDLSRKKIDIKD